MNTAAQTILQLQDKLNSSEKDRRDALLAQAEMEHELNMLRTMRRDVMTCLTDRRIGSTAHRINKIARILRADEAHAA